MRFIDFLLVCAIIGILHFSIFGGISLYTKLDEQIWQKQKCVTTKKFVAESFIKTCEGKGFNSLNDWQMSCRTMFDLDYIAWAEASNFMNVSYSETDSPLIYGVWRGKFCDGEIYCRKNNLCEDIL